MLYFMGKHPDTASEGVLAGICSEAFRNTNEINSERARKGLEARSERLRNKRLVKQAVFVCIFQCEWDIEQMFRE